MGERGATGEGFDDEPDDTITFPSANSPPCCATLRGLGTAEGPETRQSFTNNRAVVAYVTRGGKTPGTTNNTALPPGHWVHVYIKVKLITLI